MKLPSTLDVEVTQAMIDFGSHNCNNCPVALAMYSAINNVYDLYPRDISVSGRRIRVYASDTHEYFCPPEVSKFVADYDNQEPVKPFKFSTYLLY